MIPDRLGFRLQLWHSVLLVIVLAGFGLTAYGVARENETRRVDDELRRRALMLLRMPPPRPPGGGNWNSPPREPQPAPLRMGAPPPIEAAESYRGALAERVQQVESAGGYTVVWDASGAVVVSSGNAPGGIPPPVFSPAEGGPGELAQTRSRVRGEFREICGPLPFGDRIVVGRSIQPEIRGLRRLALWLVAAGAGVLAIGIAGGWWIVSRAIRPVGAIASAAREIAAGKLSRRIESTNDKSELGELSRVLNTSFAQLEALFGQQQRFVSDASHELRTPVTVILSETQTALSRERSPDEYRESLEACQRAARRMKRLAESLLQLARLDAGQERMEPQRFDLARVLRDTVELIRPMAIEHRVRLTAELTELDCVGDPEHIGRVATNLLTNAVNFNRTGGQVKVWTEGRNGKARFVVEDTGEGIPLADLPHIFERFYRVDKSRARSRGQTGLGLAIAKAIVDAHRGTIEVASHEGEGSRFTVELPGAP